jgi:hypothetical protein
LRDQRGLIGAADPRAAFVTDYGVTHRMCIVTAKCSLPAGNLGDTAAAVRDLR